MNSILYETNVQIVHCTAFNESFEITRIQDMLNYTQLNYSESTHLEHVINYQWAIDVTKTSNPQLISIYDLKFTHLIK